VLEYRCKLKDSIEYYSWTSLNEYYKLDEHLEEEETVVRVEDESIEQSNGESLEHASKLYGCEYCSLKGRERYTLHPGSIFLYVKDGKLKALADIDHVHHKCREGLIDNIGFLYSMMCSLSLRAIMWLL